MIHAVVMAGGSGTRFWPSSRKSLPKQLLPLTGERTLIQETVGRIADWIPAERTWVVTNRLQSEETARQLPELPASNILIEPCGRNTAPCIALAAAQVLARDPAGVMVVMPADHVIRPAKEFERGVRRPIELVSQDPARLVLFGVAPSYPATGFGYIEQGAATDDAALPAFQVASFREKPDRATAEQYLRSGKFLWNCGIFVWRADRILDELRRHEPTIHAATQQLAAAIGSPRWDDTLQTVFPAMKSISIDYAVLERSQSVCVLPATFEWDDVGSWQALARLFGADDQNNTVVGLHCGIDTNGCIIRSTDRHLVATMGIQDCLIVHTPDATLVARKSDEEAIRKLIAHLEAAGHARFL